MGTVTGAFLWERPWGCGMCLPSLHYSWLFLVLLFFPGFVLCPTPDPNTVRGFQVYTIFTYISIVCGVDRREPPLHTLHTQA